MFKTIMLIRLASRSFIVKSQTRHGTIGGETPPCSKFVAGKPFARGHGGSRAGRVRGSVGSRAGLSRLVWLAFAMTAILGTTLYGMTMGIGSGPIAIVLKASAHPAPAWRGRCRCRPCTCSTAWPAPAQGQHDALAALVTTSWGGLALMASIPDQLVLQRRDPGCRLPELDHVDGGTKSCWASTVDIRRGRRVDGRRLPAGDGCARA